MRRLGGVLTLTDKLLLFIYYIKHIGIPSSLVDNTPKPAALSPACLAKRYLALVSRIWTVCDNMLSDFDLIGTIEDDADAPVESESGSEGEEVSTCPFVQLTGLISQLSRLLLKTMGISIWGVTIHRIPDSVRCDNTVVSRFCGGPQVA